MELEDEDSVTERFERQSGEGDLDVAVVKLRHISNFTDFQSLALQPGIKVRYAQTAKDLETADLIVLPGTKNTIEDLIDLRNRGMDAAIVRHARSGGMVIGVRSNYKNCTECAFPYRQPGRAVISAVHDLSLAKKHGTHAVLRNRGQCTAEGIPPEELRSV